VAFSYLLSILSKFLVLAARIYVDISDEGFINALGFARSSLFCWHGLCALDRWRFWSVCARSQGGEGVYGVAVTVKIGFWIVFDFVRDASALL